MDAKTADTNGLRQPGATGRCRMNAFMKIVNALAVPFALINGFGGIVACIWLAILGEWGSIGHGLIMLVGGGFLIGVAMMPGMLFAVPAAAFHQRGNKLASYFFGFLSTLYTIGVLTVWCVGVLYFFAKRADGGSTIPVLVWSYGVATGPIAWLAHKDLEAGNEYALISTFFAQIAYLLAVLLVLLLGASLLAVLVLFGIFMLIGLGVQFRLAYLEERAQQLEP